MVLRLILHFVETDVALFNNLRSSLLITDVAGWREADYLPPFNVEFTMREFYISAAYTTKYCGDLTKGKICPIIY
jgi:hypothetical protein